MDVIERIKSQLSSSPVVLYMKGTPDFPSAASPPRPCVRWALSAPSSSTSTFSRTRSCVKRSKQYSNWPTYPQLYVNGELVGGSDIIIEMYKTGELQKLIGEAAKAAG